MKVFSQMVKQRKSGFQILSWTSSYFNILIMFTYLTALKLLSLIMDWERFTLLSVLQHVRGVIWDLQTSMIVLLTKIVSSVNLKALTILAKEIILDAWLGPGRASADRYITFHKIQTKICIDGRQVKLESF